MAASIIGRVTGGALATVGALALVWWLVAAAGSPEAWGSFTKWATSWLGIVIGVGLSWAFFQHLLTGLRHLVLDTGAGFELRTNKFWANMVLAGAIVLTIAFWALLYWVVK